MWDVLDDPHLPVWAILSHPERHRGVSEGATPTMVYRGGSDHMSGLISALGLGNMMQPKISYVIKQMHKWVKPLGAKSTVIYEEGG